MKPKVFVVTDSDGCLGVFTTLEMAMLRAIDVLVFPSQLITAWKLQRCDDDPVDVDLMYWILLGDEGVVLARIRREDVESEAC